METKKDYAYILSCARTPVGSYGGALAGVEATQLGATAIKAVVQRSGIPLGEFESVVMGNVLSANLGQAPARQAAMAAGLPTTVCATTVNKVCASGLKAVAMVAQDIQTGQINCGVAGGMESMSRVPHYLPHARFGIGYGNQSIVDGLANDGLTNAYDQQSMGCFADQTATDYHITRKHQDDFAEQSYRRSQAAWMAGLFNEEVIAITVPQRKGTAIQVTQDEECTKANFEKMRQLKPAFSPAGTVTAANASPMSDGASALVLAGAGYKQITDQQPLARIIAYAEAEQEPALFTTTPIKATQKVLTLAGLSLTDIDCFEINEAFAVVPLAFIQELNIPAEKVNINGGVVAIGHPLGASGARILTTLVHVLKQQNGRYGLVAICNGGGGASAMIIERI